MLFDHNQTAFFIAIDINIVKFLKNRSHLNNFNI